jgi:hypothetical protein
LIAKKQKAELERNKIDEKNDILATQEAMISNEIDRTNAKKDAAISNMSARHREAGKIMRASIEVIKENAEYDYEDIDNSEDFAEIGRRIKKLEEENENEG